MSVAAGEVKKSTIPQLGESGIGAFKEIADWCRQQHLQSKQVAIQHFRYVWVLIGIGIVALLFLPYALEVIDTRLLKRKLPNEILEGTQNSINDLTSALNVMKDIEDGLSLQLTEVKIDHSNANDILKKKIEYFNKSLFKAWKRGTYNNLVGGYYIWDAQDVIVREDQESFAAIGRVGDPGGIIPAVVMYSSDGLSWDVDRIKIDGEDVLGQLFSITQVNWNQLVAVGLRHQRKDNHSYDEPLVVLITDSVRAHAVSIGDQKSNAQFNDIIFTTKNTYIAVGSQESQPLISYSEDSENWSRHEVGIEATSALGSLTTIIETLDGTIVAGGRVDRRPQIFFSTGDGWSEAAIPFLDGQGEIAKIVFVGDT